MIRFFSSLGWMCAAVLSLPATAQTDSDFAQCKTRLAEQAVTEGVAQPVVDTAFASIEQIDRVIELDRSQPEFVTTFPDYYSKRVTDWRVSKGQQLLAEHGPLLRKLEQEYGIPPHYLLAFWGLETNFGGYKGKMPVLSSLATLACDRRRSAYFTQELMTALKLMERESLSPDTMVGSWAGAMGHTQFMPSAYYQYATDGDGNGQINLWHSEADALTSAANFLANLGWQPGFRWGREIALPKDFDYRLAGYQHRRSVSAWREQGITLPSGAALPASDISAYVVVPASHQGPAFLAYQNFRVIMRWNNSEFYAIAVGALANQIAGSPGLRQALPELPAYTRQDILSLQKTLNAKGFEVGKPDGILGPATRAGIREFQLANQMIADGFPTREVMQTLGLTVAQDSASS